MLSFRLFVTNTSLGALNLYSAQPHAFGTNAQTEGQLFASQAAVALLSAQHEAQLFGALESRDLIGMAKGILMQRHGIDADGAFRMLVEASQTSNIKLRHIAAWLVEHRDEI
jgi:GAF domain-containing protein